MTRKIFDFFKNVKFIQFPNSVSLQHKSSSHFRRETAFKKILISQTKVERTRVPLHDVDLDMSFHKKLVYTLQALYASKDLDDKYLTHLYIGMDRFHLKKNRSFRYLNDDEKTKNETIVFKWKSF